VAGGAERNINAFKPFTSSRLDHYEPKTSETSSSSCLILAKAVLSVMASTFPLDAIQRLPQLGPPQTIADGVALAAVGVASAAYMLNGIVWNRPDPYHDVWFKRMESRSGAGSGAKATRNIAKKLEESVSTTNQNHNETTFFLPRLSPSLFTFD
jgi:hypothetical protein